MAEMQPAVAQTAQKTDTKPGDKVGLPPPAPAKDIRIPDSGDVKNGLDVKAGTKLYQLVDEARKKGYNISIGANGNGYTAIIEKDGRYSIARADVEKWQEPLRDALEKKLSELLNPKPDTPVALPLPRVGLTPETKNWMDRMKLLADNTMRGSKEPRLADVSAFLSPETARELTSFVGKSDDDFRLEKLTGQKFQFALVSKTGEKWQIAEVPSFPAEGKKAEERKLVLHQDGSEGLVQAVIPLASAVRGGAFNFAAVRKAMSEAIERRELALVRQGQTMGLDLTKDAIGYVGLADQNATDPLRASLRRDVESFPGFMNSLQNRAKKDRYNFVTNGDSQLISVDREPAQILGEQLAVMYQKGIRNFYLNLAGEGRDGKIQFQAGERTLSLSAADLQKLFTKYKDSTFVVDTICSTGGGIANPLSKYTDPSGKEDRILVRSVGTPESRNVEGRIAGEKTENGAPLAFSTYLNVLNVGLLASGFPYGHAQAVTEQFAKRICPSSSAEMWRSSPNP